MLQQYVDRITLLVDIFSCSTSEALKKRQKRSYFCTYYSVEKKVELSNFFYCKIFLQNRDLCRWLCCRGQQPLVMQMRHVSTARPNNMAALNIKLHQLYFTTSIKIPVFKPRWERIDDMGRAGCLEYAVCWASLRCLHIHPKLHIQSLVV